MQLQRFTEGIPDVVQEFELNLQLQPTVGNT